MNDIDLIERVYAAYNRRDADALLAFVDDDVDWPDGPDGSGRLRGKRALRLYWERQWDTTRTRDEVVAVATLDRERPVARISQVVRSPEGALLSANSFEHRFHMRGGLILRLDIRRG